MWHAPLRYSRLGQAWPACCLLPQAFCSRPTLQHCSVQQVPHFWQSGAQCWFAERGCFHSMHCSPQQMHVHSYTPSPRPPLCSDSAASRQTRCCAASSHKCVASASNPGTDMAPVPSETGVAPEAVAEAYHAFEQGSQVAPLTAAAVSNQTIQESMRLLLLVRAYQVGCTCQGSACCRLDTAWLGSQMSLLLISVWQVGFTCNEGVPGVNMPAAADLWVSRGLHLH